MHAIEYSPQAWLDNSNGVKYEKISKESTSLYAKNSNKRLTLSRVEKESVPLSTNKANEVLSTSVAR